MGLAFDEKNRQALLGLARRYLDMRKLRNVRPERSRVERVGPPSTEETFRHVRHLLERVCLVLGMGEEWRKDYDAPLSVFWMGEAQGLMWQLGILGQEEIELDAREMASQFVAPKEA